LPGPGPAPGNDAPLLWSRAVTGCEHVFGSNVVEQREDCVTDQPFIPIVREPTVPRLAAARRAIEAEIPRLRALPHVRDDILAALYADRALVADDEHGRQHGLVIQADGLLWPELDDLATLVEPVLDPRLHAGPGTWHVDCPSCRAAQAAARLRTHRRYRTVGPRRP
jgi:hypothetical protein